MHNYRMNEWRFSNVIVTFVFWMVVLSILIVAASCTQQGQAELTTLRASAAQSTGPTVHLANYSILSSPGWVRTTVDKLPPHARGTVDGVDYVVGRRVGLETWAIDVRASLFPGETRTLDLSAATVSALPVVGLPGDPWQHFGGALTVNGVPLQITSLTIDGTAWSVHLHARVTPMLYVQCWVLWRGDEPGLMHGEVAVTTSNPSVPDLTASTTGLWLQWGDAITYVAGAGWGAPIVPAGTTFGNGQVRAVPFVLAWPRHLKTERDWLSALAAANRTTCAVGVSKLLADGNPLYPSGFDAKKWTTDRYSESLRRLHTWEQPMAGPNMRSGDTGGQEDQIFVRGESLLPGGLGAEQVAYLSALKMLARPCHHLEVDGRIVNPTTAVPRLIYWDGVPHWHFGVSPNRLGKERNATIEETNGWGGPDVEHWLMNTHAAASRLTGSHALQWGLSHQSMIYMGQQTTTPGWSTSQAYASRAVGYEGMNVVHLWRELEDRTLADRVRLHWIKRYTDVIAPAWRDKDIVDVRIDDPRLGPGPWWMPWQQSLGAYGLDLVCTQIGPPEGRVIALRIAKAVMNDAWVKVGERWQTRPIKPVAPGGTSDEAFNGFGMPCAIAVVLRHEPTNVKARAIWDQVKASGSLSWLAPGVQ